MKKFTNLLLRTSKETYTSFSQWILTIQISQTELLLLLPCSIVVLLIGSETGLNKVWFKLLRNLLWWLIPSWNHLKLKLSKMKPGIKLLSTLSLESIIQSFNSTKDWLKVLKSLITSLQEISLISSNTLLNFTMKRSHFLKINNSIWMLVWISWN